MDKSVVLMSATSSVSNATSFSSPPRSSTGDRVKSSSRKEVAAKRFDIAFSSLHPLRSSLCSRARSRVLRSFRS
jgi:hypothetical protein